MPFPQEFSRELKDVPVSYFFQLRVSISRVSFSALIMLVGW